MDTSSATLPVATPQALMDQVDTIVCAKSDPSATTTLLSSSTTGLWPSKCYASKRFNRQWRRRRRVRSGYDSPTVISSPASYMFRHNGDNHSGGNGNGIGLNSGSQYHGHYSSQTNEYVDSQQRLPYHHNHSRSHSNASDTSLSIDTESARHNSPGPASLSSASSSRRGSISETASTSRLVANGRGTFGGLFSRRRTSRRSGAGTTYSDTDDDLDLDLDNRITRVVPVVVALVHANTDRKKMNKGPSNNGTGDGILGHNGMSKLNGLLNDWNMLLPSGDRYEDDDNEMTNNERWKKEQLTKRGWNNPTGQKVILIVLTVVAVLVRIWKLAVPSAVMYV
ncbi:MAG: hypothetical protein J3Q66DRAFT_82244 [Benniella sp.]|nr:MAG: hypothetical protein J3Q66DRAFT_82244 [Benniella sp.]